MSNYRYRKTGLELDVLTFEERDVKRKLETQKNNWVKNESILDKSNPYEFFENEDLQIAENPNVGPDYIGEENFSKCTSGLLCVTKMTKEELSDLYERCCNKENSLNQIDVFYEDVYPSMTTAYGGCRGFYKRTSNVVKRDLKRFSA